MALSESADRLKIMIEKAIDDHMITRAEMDSIMHVVLEDNVVDPQEQALLNQLQDMIENKTIKIVP
jgi:hypothetical protein